MSMKDLSTDNAEMRRARFLRVVSSDMLCTFTYPLVIEPQF